MISYSATTLTISETVQTNCIAWIRSLPENEIGPSRRILEDLETFALTEGFPVFTYDVGTREELLQVLKQLSSEAMGGLRPVVHIDAHGTENDGLLLAPSGERLGWFETISALRELNAATANNLTCVFALCFGLHIYKHIKLKEPVPAYLFCAPPSEISVGFLESQTLDFYRQVISSGNVTSAFESTLGKVMDSFHCQGLFLQVLLQYIRTSCTAKQRKERAESLVTAVMKRDGIKNPTSTQLNTARKEVKALLTPGQHLIDLFARRFLVGRNAAFTYEDICKLLDGTAGQSQKAAN